MWREQTQNEEWREPTQIKELITDQKEVGREHI
jgi:hypothetical protein